LGLTAEEKKILRQVAQSSIERRLKGEKPGKMELSGEHLKEHRGAFVTLNKHGQLRGCIGTIQPSRPLYQVVEEMAAAAAFEDSRFSPLTVHELKDLELEISVLTPLQRIKDINEIEIGKHGLISRRVSIRASSFPRWPRNITGTGRLSWRKPAARPAYTEMPGGKKGQKFTCSRRISFKFFWTEINADLQD
jgi:AmmeMemoRadiSam system protein A